MTDYSHYDDALTQLKDCGPDLKNTFTSHMPMVVEALCRMDQGHKAVGWLAPRLDQAVPLADYKTVQPIGEGWQDGLARAERFADWRVLFADEIARDGWQAVLETWVPRLAPGYVGAATHGVLRAAHAARAVAAGESALRLDELAQGLALWASTFQSLPMAGQAPDNLLSLEDALAAVPLVPEAERENEGAITHALTILNDRVEFAAIGPKLAFADDARETALDLAEALVGLYLRHAKDALSSIVFTHGVTSMAASYELMGLVSRQAGETLLRYAWQGVAGVYATYGDPAAMAEGRMAETPEEIVVQAVAHGDDHVIKLAEACLTLHALRGNTQFLTAPGLARACMG